MGFTGDSICIKADLTFDRIENLKVGDLLYNPNSSTPTKIKNIETFYSDEGYSFRTENFFEINISKDTFINTASLNMDRGKFYLSQSNFITPENLNKLCFLIMPKITTKETTSLEELFLYSKLLLKGSYNEDENKIIFNRFNEKYKYYQENSNNKNINIINNKEIKKMYINEANKIPWVNTLNKNTAQRNLSNQIFNLQKDELLKFLEEFLKENTEFYLDNNNFRLYTQSKIIAMQLFYLFLGNTDKVPKIEQIKKDIWNLKNIKGSNKKNKYSIACHNDIKPILLKENNYYQQVTFFDKNKRNLKYIKIITENNEPFIVYNTIVKEK